jgi:formylglycine-generating enzyme required for sulfatase activity
MLTVPAGTARLGSHQFAEPSDPGWTIRESPFVQVTIARPFALGRFEVTFAEWDACVADGGCSHRPGDFGWGRERRPVVDIYWDETQSYLAWLGRKTGKRYRLPSEAEWEYAARAGTRTPWYTGETLAAAQANFSTYIGQTLPVGSYPANLWGFHDMIGNVWEWVEDCPLDGQLPADGSAVVRREFLGPGRIGAIIACDDQLRLMKGGAWNTNRIGARPGYRGHADARPVRGVRSARMQAYGFRVARDL